MSQTEAKCAARFGVAQWVVLAGHERGERWDQGRYYKYHEDVRAAHKRACARGDEAVCR